MAEARNDVTPIGGSALHTTGPSGSNSGLRWTLLFAVFLAALLAARVGALHLNGTDLFFDEAQYWAWSEEPAFGYYSKPPLIAWVIRAATELCGDAEACVRLPSPLIHSATAVVIFLLAARLYDARVGAYSGLAFATLPGVSVSAGIISTDVPLLLAWAASLLALAALFDTRAWWPALLLGAALGFGLNAKYAMGWFILCLALYLAMTPSRRAILGDARLYVALVIALALIAPNLKWNLAHGFATFAHTADNAKWDGMPFNPLEALAFLGAQFGVFGPILFASLLVIAWRAWKRGLPDVDRFLLFFSLPIILVITGQAFLSRAHANWAAPAYVAATLLVTASLLRGGYPGVPRLWPRVLVAALERFRSSSIAKVSGPQWLGASLALHVAVAALIICAATLAGRVAPPSGIADPFARTMGWAELAAATRAEIEKARARGQPFAAVVADQRRVTAELLYYMRGEPTPVLAWRDGGPEDHFELTRPFTARTGEPVLLVSLKAAGHITSAFASVTDLGALDLPAGARDHRHVAFTRLAGYRGR